MEGGGRASGGGGGRAEARCGEGGREGGRESQFNGGEGEREPNWEVAAPEAVAALARELRSRILYLQESLWGSVAADPSLGICFYSSMASYSRSCLLSPARAVTFPRPSTSPSGSLVFFRAYVSTALQMSKSLRPGGSGVGGRRGIDLRTQFSMAWV